MKTKQSLGFKVTYGTSPSYSSLGLKIPPTSQIFVNKLYTLTGPTKSFTVAFWINFYQDHYGYINTGGLCFTAAPFTTNTPPIETEVSIQDSRTFAHLYLPGPTNSVTFTSARAVGVPALYVISCDRSTNKKLFYRNTQLIGTLVGSFPTMSTFTFRLTPTNGRYIYQLDDRTPRAYYSNYTMWNRALSAVEVNTLYALGSTPYTTAKYNALPA